MLAVLSLRVKRPGRKWVTHLYLVLYAIVAFEGRTLRIVTEISYVMSSFNECRIVDCCAFLLYFLTISG